MILEYFKCFSTVSGLTRFWNQNALHDIIYACIITHNMIIEDERDVNTSIKEEMEVSNSKSLDGNRQKYSILKISYWT